MRRERPVTAPPLWLTALETRAASEYMAWSALKPVLSHLKRGDGHPVFVLPGFMTGDRSTLELRALLRRLGYRTYGWGLGANLGPTHHIVDGLSARFEKIVQREQRPVSLIGWSLGGIYARELARSNANDVRQVITLGSPIQMAPGDDSAASSLWKSLENLHVPDSPEFIGGQNRAPLPVPTTSVYTRTDGIVDWRTCLETRGPIAENVEVVGSHCGLGFQPAVAVVLADRLAQADGEWRRFRPPLWLRGFYPIPTNHRPQRATAA